MFQGPGPSVRTFKRSVDPKFSKISFRCLQPVPILQHHLVWVIFNKRWSTNLFSDDFIGWSDYGNLDSNRGDLCCYRREKWISRESSSLDNWSLCMYYWPFIWINIWVSLNIRIWKRIIIQWCNKSCTWSGSTNICKSDAIVWCWLSRYVLAHSNYWTVNWWSHWCFNLFNIYFCSPWKQMLT